MGLYCSKQPETTFHQFCEKKQFISPLTTVAVDNDGCLRFVVTSSSAIAERPRDAQVTSIRKIAKWNF